MSLQIKRAEAAEGLAAQSSPQGAALVLSGSLEIGAHRPQDVATIAATLPPGTPVYVNHLPRHRLSDVLLTLIAVREAGLEPVPHLAARRIESPSEIEIYLRAAVRDAGVKRALVIGGDVAEPCGPFADGAALIGSGLLVQAGLEKIGIAGYPEGHPRIPSKELERAFAQKRTLLAEQGLAAYVVTQFSFAADRVVRYCAGLARSAPEMPVYVGMAGPTNPVALLRFARQCGVSASLGALRAQGFNAVKLVTQTDPSAQLETVARHCANFAGSNVAGVHVFTFGGVLPAVQWMSRCINLNGSRALA